MKYYGYHRTSTKEQHLDRGITAITDYCNEHNIKLEKIYTDQQTGKNFNRPRYTILKEDTLREGDVLILSELDRLGRNRRETLKELQYYKDHGIRVMILEIPNTCIHTEDNLTLEFIADLLIQVYSYVAQAEIEKKEKRQKEGIQAKKDRGEWADYGRPHAEGRDQFFNGGYEKVLAGELRPVDLMNQSNLTKPTYYRYKKEYEAMQSKKK